jgi:hypothetical protein
MMECELYYYYACLYVCSPSHLLAVFDSVPIFGIRSWFQASQAENVNGCLLFDTKILLDWNEAILTVHLVIYFAA